MLYPILQILVASVTVSNVIELFTHLSASQKVKKKNFPKVMLVMSAAMQVVREHSVLYDTSRCS